MSATSSDARVVANVDYPVGEPQFMCAYCLLEFFTQEEAKDHFIHTSCQKKAEEDGD